MRTSHAALVALFSLLLCHRADAQDAPECFRHAQCPDDELCIDTVCQSPAVPPPVCEKAEDCDQDSAACDDGFCKQEGVYCQNPAGHCYTESGENRCACENGMGMGGGTVGEPEPMTDEELYAECLQILSLSCGDEAPDINDECSEEALQICTDYFDKISLLREACGEQGEQPGYAELAHCCRGADDEEFLDHKDCVMSIEASQCERLDDCWPQDGTWGGVPEQDAGLGDGTEAGGAGAPGAAKDSDDGAAGADGQAAGEDAAAFLYDNDGGTAEERNGGAGCRVARPGAAPGNGALAYLMGLATAILALGRRRRV
jgi:hypothetical protein